MTRVMIKRNAPGRCTAMQVMGAVAIGCAITVALAFSCAAPALAQSSQETLGEMDVTVVQPAQGNITKTVDVGASGTRNAPQPLPKTGDAGRAGALACLGALSLCAAGCAVRARRNNGEQVDCGKGGEAS